MHTIFVNTKINAGRRFHQSLSSQEKKFWHAISFQNAATKSIERIKEVKPLHSFMCNVFWLSENHPFHDISIHIKINAGKRFHQNLTSQEKKSDIPYRFKTLLRRVINPLKRLDRCVRSYGNVF